MAMTSREEEVRFAEHPGEHGRALWTADAGHVDQSQLWEKNICGEPSGSVVATVV